MEIRFIRVGSAGAGQFTAAALSILALLVLWSAGCQKPAPTAPTEATNPPVVVQPSVHLDHAQANLPLVKLWVGAEELTTELCATSQQLATGMMFRTNLDESAGMLFAFPYPHRTAFYMRNTTVPLSAAYIDPEGVILEIHDLMPLEEKAVEASSDMVQFVLEVKQGWFQRHNIPTGSVLRVSSGPLRQVLNRR